MQLCRAQQYLSFGVQQKECRRAHDAIISKVGARHTLFIAVFVRPRVAGGGIGKHLQIGIGRERNQSHTPLLEQGVVGHQLLQGILAGAATALVKYQQTVGR